MDEGTERWDYHLIGMVLDAPGEPTESGRHVQRQKQWSFRVVHSPGIGSELCFCLVDGRLRVGDDSFQKPGNFVQRPRLSGCLRVCNGKAPVLAGEPELGRWRGRHL